jgi:hypothetical protein
MGEALVDTAESENLSMRQDSNRENRESPEVPMPNGGAGRLGKVHDHAPNMHASGKSDRLVVPTKQANKTGPTAVAEPVEGRRLAKGIARPTLHAPDSEPGLAWHRIAGRTTSRRAADRHTRGRSRMR